jgi:hypothetical protein|tara:strand:- start:155 stop:385 length:231 start_codon:yes stop_codon:yes gene_type:complete
MQKLINVLAVLSFVGTAGIIGSGYYLYTQKDPIIEGLKEKVTKAAVEGVTNALPGLVDAAMPELPTTTGPALPSLP